MSTIESVSKVEWREELKVWAWYLEVQKMEDAGKFQSVSYGMSGGASDDVCKAFRELMDAADKSNRKTANVLAYLNFKAGEHLLEMANDGTDRYWLRINGHVVHFELADEYGGRGSIRSGLTVLYVDREADDAFWVAIANELTLAADCKAEGMHPHFAEEWAEFYE